MKKAFLIMSSQCDPYAEYPYTAFLIDSDKITGGELEVEFELHFKTIKNKTLPKCELFRRWLIGRGYEEIELDDNVTVF